MFNNSLPRLGFVGLGWIGRNRLTALLAARKAVIEGIYDTDPKQIKETLTIAPNAKVFDSYESLLTSEIDGIVIATPNSFHYEQIIKALQKNLPVFCQKPLARNSFEVQNILNLAKAKNKLLGIDLSYRYLRGSMLLKQLISGEKIGQIYAIESSFHNAYGPDKKWFYDKKLAGGGCLIDLSTHLIDYVLWILTTENVGSINSHLYADGEKCKSSGNKTENYASVNFLINDSILTQITSSWNTHAGQDAVINYSFYGTEGSLHLHNINGSYYDFILEHAQKTKKSILDAPPDDWGGGAIIKWATTLSKSASYDPSVQSILKVATIIDIVYKQNNLF